MSDEDRLLPAASRSAVRSPGPPSGTVYSPKPERYPEGQVEFRDIWAALRRRSKTILVTVVVVVALVLAWTLWMIPVWSADTLLRVEEREGGLLAAPALIALTGLGGAGSQIETELRVLHTRPIAEDVVDRLDLALVVTHPRDIPRETLFAELDFGRVSLEDEFEISVSGDGRYRIRSTSDETPQLDREFAAGERVDIAGGSFVLRDFAVERAPDGDRMPRVVEFETLPFQEAVEELFDDLSVSRPDPQASILKVSYRSTDRTLVHQVPNAIAEAFMERRSALDKADARSTVSYIQAQVDTTYSQLRAVEDSLRAFQEGERVVAVEAEAAVQVERLGALQAQRAEIDAERTALGSLVEDIEGGTAPDYRRLASFPTFFQNPAVGGMLSSLIQADSARSALLARATPRHPDVIAVEERIDELEAQLGSIGRNYLQSLDAQLAAIDAELARFGTELEGVPDRQITYARIRRHVEMLGELYTMLQTRLKEAEVQEAIDDSSVRIVERAIEPLRPRSPKPVRNLAVALALGLVLGVVLAFVREYLDRRLRADDDPETLFGLSTIARIPSLAGEGKGRAKRLVALDDVPSAEAEAYRSMRTGLGHLSERGVGQVLTVASPSTGEGCSVVAANLAISLALGGVRTLLIDADLRRPSQHLHFGLSNPSGLTDLLRDDQPLESVIRVAADVASLDVLTAGSHVGSPAEILDGRAMEDLLRVVRGRYEMVIIDTPPVLAVADAVALARRTDATVLVVRAEKTEKEAMQLAIQQLRQVGSVVLGVVVTDAEAESSYQSRHDEYYGRPSPRGWKSLVARLAGKREIG